MNRTEFQQMAEIRIEEAAALLAQQKWDGAYYLAGYAVECALKACIAKSTKEHDFPPPRKEWEDSYTHDLNRLLQSAGLAPGYKNYSSSDIAFRENWSDTKDWNESNRYQRKTQFDAEKLYKSIVEPAHGVLPWLKKFW